MSIELQKIDCNCNDCKSMVRDLSRMPKRKGQESYGHCTKFDKPVIFWPGQCRPDNQECFVHRKDL